MTSPHHLEKRVDELESASDPEGERPPELTPEEKRMLATTFDVDPWDRDDGEERSEPPYSAGTGGFYRLCMEELVGE